MSESNPLKSPQAMNFTTASSDWLPLATVRVEGEVEVGKKGSVEWRELIPGKIMTLR